jgi:predicted AlkP superfamily pyrophosphatase or phosphodiesterase
MNNLCIFIFLAFEIRLAISSPVDGINFSPKYVKYDEQNLPNLILISFDGFRWDYLENHTLPFIQKYFVENGAKVNRGIKSAFTTVTFPNHWTLATGFYPESHGII